MLLRGAPIVCGPPSANTLNAKGVVAAVEHSKLFVVS